MCDLVTATSPPMASLFSYLGRSVRCEGLLRPDLWAVVRLVSEILMGDSLEKCRESGRCLFGVNQHSSIKTNRFFPSGAIKAFPSVKALVLSM